MKKVSVISLLLILAFGIGNFSCDKLSKLLAGKWSLSKVTASGSVAGVTKESSDEEPSGYILFNSDGSGLTAYSFSLFGIPYPSASSFDWTREGDVISISKDKDESGDAKTWTVVSEDDTTMVLEWDLLDTIGEVDATITITLTK